MRGGTGDAMFEISLRENEVLKQSVTRRENAEDQQRAQSKITGARHLPKQDQRDWKQRHLQPERILAE